ncbi:MAG TPA: GNAT family N-acetyltransferase [Tepidisphaeraceae bacterium]|nr:GNAT family N-acetyltransferase [Tepidisphaeraceae bacterium]
MNHSEITFRPGRSSDAEATAKICFDAFTDINLQHGFAPDFKAPEMTLGFMKMILENPHVISVVAEKSGKIVGSNFLWEGAIGGIGPITVDQTIQDKGVGRQLMEYLLQQAEQRHMAGTRLVQAAFNRRSLSLYTKLGFNVREPLACLQGTPIHEKIPGHEVRKMSEADIDACCDVCTRIHGHDRRGELFVGIAQKTALVVEHAGRITGYATDIGLFGHTVAMNNIDLMALIAAADQISGPGFLLPMRNGEIFRWCLSHGLRMVQPMTLMSRGLYNEPQGSFLASILF